VIILENSNEWNLTLAKEGSSKKERERKKEREKKKKRARIEKQKRWNLI
jgi:hypothetical protein